MKVIIVQVSLLLIFFTATALLIKCDQFICVSHNKQLVTILNMDFQYECTNGLVCNTNNSNVTCEPCITEAPPPPPPDCNDGNSATKPCRYINGTPDIYYRCKRVWNWYEHETFLCSDLQAELNCQPNFNCTEL